MDKRKSIEKPNFGCWEKSELRENPVPASPCLSSRRPFEKRKKKRGTPNKKENISRVRCCSDMEKPGVEPGTFST
jgi:hypothetical protein